MEISGKVALVTGSSRGIGRQIARELAAKGARVAVHYRADREVAQEALVSLSGGPHASPDPALLCTHKTAPNTPR